MTGARRAIVVAVVGVTSAAIACASDPSTDVPVAPAPASRHAQLVEALVDDAGEFAFSDGRWQENLGDAAFYGLAWLARRAESGALDANGLVQRDAALERARVLLQRGLFDSDLPGSSDSVTFGGVRWAATPIEEQVMAALGVLEHVAASRDRSMVSLLDAFVDRLDAFAKARGDYIEMGSETGRTLAMYGPTAVTAFVALVEAQYALLVGGDRGQERLGRALAIDAKIRERALTDLSDAASGRAVRGYAFAPGRGAGLVDAPNLAMLLLKARLYRLTRDEVFRLEARAIYVALQPLKLTDSPARYSSPYAKLALGTSSRDLTTLSGQNYVTLALLLLFEVTGDRRFVDEADRLLDGVIGMRGPWCASHVHDPAGCSAACGPSQACVAGSCTAERCTTGLLHHVVDGRLALPSDGAVFCAGCSLQTLYVAGYRRMLAGERY